jgi:hypothetical protein
MSAKDQTEARSFSQEDVDRIVQDRLARDRQARAQVTHEPRVYALDSPHSFFGDVVNSELNGAEARSARDRLARYATELSHEAARGSLEGRRAERIIGQVDRHNEERSKQRVREFRALASGGGATASASGGGGAAFVTPIFINDAWAAFRGGWRTFADQCHTLPLSPYGMEAYVPAFSSAAGAAQQTEGAAVTETDPSTQLQGAPVVTITGQITLSQQLHDRGYAGGGSLDAVIGRQISQQLEQNVDVYVLNQVLGGIPGGGVILDNVAPAPTTFIANLYADLAKAREAITDTAGVRLRPTHIFSTSDLFSYVTRQVDSQNRPIVVPQQAPGMPLRNGADDGQNGAGALPKWARFTGLIWPGDVLWFTDDNIPASGADTQILVSAPDEAVLLLESPDPILTVYPQTVGNQLQVIVNLRKYVAAINRHSSGSATISGSAYPTSSV